MVKNLRGSWLIMLLSFVSLIVLGCSIQPDNTSVTKELKASANGISQQAVNFTRSDYALALQDSVIFFDANKCGPNAGVGNYFSWRGACHTQDGSDVSLDLTGGYHDAGDHVKFALPAGYAMGVLNWALYEFGDSFTASSSKAKLDATLRYFADYVFKSHPNATTFYYQVGFGDEDHAYWGAPETQGKRNVKYVATASTPASDVLCQNAAALAIMHLNYKTSDPTLAAKCLKVAKELYAMAKTTQGKSAEESFYTSYSFRDDLAWAAAWLYQIEGTASYLTDVNTFLSFNTDFGVSAFENKWTMCWDDMYLATFMKMAQLTGAQKYKDALTYNINYWQSSGISTSPSGYKVLNSWGSTRYNAAEMMIIMMYYKMTGNTTLKTFAKGQIDYILGNNPNAMSYLIGFGSKYPTHPHHRAANGYTYANGGNLLPAKYLLLGALVGGPDSTDTYKDNGAEYQYTEVAIDYNASLVGALAAMVALIDGTVVISSASSQPPVSSAPVASSSRVSSTAVSSTASSIANLKNIPGKIEAESYNAMSGIQTETCSEGTLNVGWIDLGDWMEYNVNVTATGNFTLEYRVASTTANGKIDISLDGVNKASTPVPNTGGWQNWTTVSIPLSLNTGTGAKKIRLTATGGGFNINWLNIKTAVASSSSSAVVSSKSSSKSSVSSAVISSSKSSITSSVSSRVSSTATSTSGNIKVQAFNGSLNASDNQLYPRFKLINTGTTAISLSAVKIRYFFTVDGTAAQSFFCDYSQAGSANVTGTFSAYSPVKANADRIMETGFTAGAGTLAAGASIEVQIRVAKTDWSAFNQANDYSFNSTATAYTDTTKIELILNGVTVSGVRP